MPVGKPAPPRPRSTEPFTAAITSSGFHRQRLGQRLVPAGPAVAGQRERVRLVPVRGEDRGQGVWTRWSQRLPPGAFQPRSLASFEPDQAGRPRRRALGGLAVAEPGEDPVGLLPGAQPVGAAGRRHVLAGPQVVDELLRRLRRLVVEELPVDHDHGRVVAGRVALKALDGDLAVRRLDVVVPVVAGVAAQVLGELRPDLVAAHDRAGRVDADPDLVLGGRLVLVHGVEGRHAEHLGLRDAEHLRAEGHPLVGDVALLRLHQVKQRQQRGPRLRVPSGDLRGVRLQPGQRFLTERHYRSTPPITGSIDAIAGITSARLPPSHSTETACRWWNEGSRRCARYGRVPPSLTTWQPSSPLARLDRHVGLAGRHPEALGHQLEVVDERLHGLAHDVRDVLGRRAQAVRAERQPGGPADLGVLDQPRVVRRRRRGPRAGRRLLR